MSPVTGHRSPNPVTGHRDPHLPAPSPPCLELPSSCRQQSQRAGQPASDNNAPFSVSEQTAPGYLAVKSIALTGAAARHPLAAAAVRLLPPATRCRCRPLPLPPAFRCRLSALPSRPLNIPRLPNPAAIAARVAESVAVRHGVARRGVAAARGAWRGGGYSGPRDRKHGPDAAVRSGAGGRGRMVRNVTGSSLRLSVMRCRAAVFNC